MNGKYFFTPAIAILAIALVGYAETTRTTGVVTVGPIMPTVSTPRVRVANDRHKPISVWFIAVGGNAGQRLGSVAALATETFTVPDTVRALRLVVRPQETRGTQYVTADIQIGPETHVSLRVARELGRTNLEVGRVHVIEPPKPPTYPSPASGTAPPDA